MHQVPVEGMVVAKTEACDQPMAMTVELEHTRLTDRAVVASWRLEYLARFAESEAE